MFDHIAGRGSFFDLENHFLCSICRDPVDHLSHLRVGCVKVIDCQICRDICITGFVVHYGFFCVGRFYDSGSSVSMSVCSLLPLSTPKPTACSAVL